jgi:hypothetical protein
MSENGRTGAEPYIIEQCRSRGLGGHDREREAKIRKEYIIALWTDLDEEKTY